MVVSVRRGFAVLVVLLDAAVLVVDVQARGHRVGDDPSAEYPWGVASDLPTEDQADLVGAADVEVVSDGLLEKDPPRDRFVQHLGQAELGLQDRELVAVARRAVRRGERVRQPGQPLTQQRVDTVRGQAIAERLHPRHVGGVVDGGEAVVQRAERRASA
jgi:hypothetical protein